MDRISDAALLNFCGATYAGFGAFNLFAPKISHDYNLTDKGGPQNDVITRYQGWALGAIGAQTFVSAAGSSKTQKAALKATGFVCVANLGANIYATQKGYLKKESAVPASVLLGVVSTLCLVKGFQKPKEAAANEPKPSAVAASAAPKKK